MTWRIDAQPLTNRWTISGVGGFGGRGDSVPTTGTHGPSCLADLVTLPADAAAEFRAQVTQWPTDGELVMFEDGGFIYTAATPDAEDTAQVQRYKNGLLVDAQQIQLTVGNPAGIVTASWPIGATAQLQWGGRKVALSAWSVTAVANVNWQAGSSNLRTGSWPFAATAQLQWGGRKIALGNMAINAVAAPSWQAGKTAMAAWPVAASARLDWLGSNPQTPPRRNEITMQATYSGPLTITGVY